MKVVDEKVAIQDSMRLMVRHRPMIVADLALRLGVSSKVVRTRVHKAEDLYIWDGMVRYGERPDYLA